MVGTFNIWEGMYESFHHADLQSVGMGFRGDIYNKRASDAAAECLLALKTGNPIPAFHKQRSNLLPPIVAMMLKDKSKLNILDFGGGLGIGYMTLAESIPSYLESISYTIVELPEVCKQGRKIHNKQITFKGSIPTGHSFDLIHSASALQYVEDWQGLLEQFSSLNSQYILLSDVFTGDIPTFVTLQNYYSSKMRHWFFNLEEFVSFFSGIGYTLEMKSYVNSRRLDADDILPMENFPESHRIKQTLHLLFKKK